MGAIIVHHHRDLGRSAPFPPDSAGASDPLSHSPDIERNHLVLVLKVIHCAIEDMHAGNANSKAKERYRAKATRRLKRIADDAKRFLYTKDLEVYLNISGMSKFSTANHMRKLAENPPEDQHILTAWLINEE